MNSTPLRLACIMVAMLLTNNCNVSARSRYKNRLLRLEDGMRHSDDNSMTAGMMGGEKCDFGICLTVKNYPGEKIMKLLDKTKDVHQTFFGDVIEPTDTADMAVGNRASFGRFGDVSETLCQSQRRTVRPRLQRDINNKMKYVVNLADFEQIVTFETCVSQRKQSCFGSELLLNYTTECVQKYNVIKLLAISESGDNLEYGRFLIPSTCVCAYTQ